MGTDEDQIEGKLEEIATIGEYPDLGRTSGSGAAHGKSRRWWTVEEQYVRPRVAQGVEVGLGLDHPFGPTFLEFVARRARIGVPDLPELMDKGFALVIFLEDGEQVALGVGDQRSYLLQPIVEPVGV